MAGVAAMAAKLGGVISENVKTRSEMKMAAKSVMAKWQLAMAAWLIGISAKAAYHPAGGQRESVISNNGWLATRQSLISWPQASHQRHRRNGEKRRESELASMANLRKSGLMKQSMRKAIMAGESGVMAKMAAAAKA